MTSATDNVGTQSLSAGDCCDAGAFAELASGVGAPKPVDVDGLAPIADASAFVTKNDHGDNRLHLLVENLHCAACISKIEGALTGLSGVTHARVNMSTHRLCVDWQDGSQHAKTLMQTVQALGYPVAPFDAEEAGRGQSNEDKKLLSALGVAGFAAANVMLLSVAVWAGHGAGMGDGTRTLFHWISAMIAVPAVAYAGQPFFKSAYQVLRHRRLNMDVPISLAVVLASIMSLYQTAEAAEHAYFDASVSLLFFLLVGRYLDHQARAKARSAATHLLGLQATAATVLQADGTLAALRIRDVAPGMTVCVAAGERIPLDGVVSEGTSDIDTALVTGETTPRLAELNNDVFAGTLNLTAPLKIRVTAGAENSLLSEIVRLMETAEQGRAKYVRLADRVAQIYAPVVHLLAAITFMGWILFTNAGWQPSLMAAIAVLIITCPCALGLAVPVVQVVASGQLLRSGVLVKSGDGLERLADVDTVVFDKTGTLTMGFPKLLSATGGDRELALAAALADSSKHPLSRALSYAAGRLKRPAIEDVREVPGCGLEGIWQGERIRLGKADWCGVDTETTDDACSEIWLAAHGYSPVAFRFEDTVRADAKQTIVALKRAGLQVELLSGDHEHAVRFVAEQVGIDAYQATCLPSGKVARLSELAAEGRKVLMVGDGLNDAPALAAGFVSMSPSSAADVSQTASDLVFQGKSLLPVFRAHRIAVQARKRVFENFGLAFAYNAVAIPLAVVGLATPLVAAIAMSSSSVIVTLNALRLRLLK